MQFNCSLGRYELIWTIFFILFCASNCFISRPPEKSQKITKLDFFTLSQKVQMLDLVNSDKALQDQLYYTIFI